MRKAVLALLSLAAASAAGAQGWVAAGDDPVRSSPDRRESNEQVEARQPSGGFVAAPDDSVAGWRREQRDAMRATREGGALVPLERPLPPVLRRDPDRGNVLARRPAEGSEPPIIFVSPDHRRYRQWSVDWRNDRRYAWRQWRHRYRDQFHLGVYADPFGWDYRRLTIGRRLWPLHYDRRYWLSDPWHYRLPPGYGPYRWVRYFNDALLVDLATGEVVDVVHDVFW